MMVYCIIQMALRRHFLHLVYFQNLITIFLLFNLTFPNYAKDYIIKKLLATPRMIAPKKQRIMRTVQSRLSFEGGV